MIKECLLAKSTPNMLQKDHQSALHLKYELAKGFTAKHIKAHISRVLITHGL